MTLQLTSDLIQQALFVDDTAVAALGPADVQHRVHRYEGQVCIAAAWEKQSRSRGGK